LTSVDVYSTALSSGQHTDTHCTKRDCTPVFYHYSTVFGPSFTLYNIPCE